MDKILSFDIELSDIIEVQELNTSKDLHISVAATVILGEKGAAWYSYGLDTATKEICLNLLRYLSIQQDSGYKVCAWNGLGFDLKWIGHNAEDMELAKQVALRSYDPMFQFYNQRGFPIGLASVAKAFGIEQEKSMHGSEAPVRWKEGRKQEVIDYVIGDCELTNQIVEKIIGTGGIVWMPQSGIKAGEPMILKTVAEVLLDPLPDQGWMTNTIPREQFTGWLEL
ncbi:hypothetical protein LCGC14_0422380 [marine sediment metagenome]|uniref:YprB ribonuclease H-like domain-containing protein n=1 Tax=marine sediment metagenome TaxID=412755 RepID=A0A0F9VZW6_9ZZZZ